MTVATTPVEALERGIEIIKEKGWTQDVLQDGTGAVCALGAVRAATYGFRRDGRIRATPPKGAFGILNQAELLLQTAAEKRGAEDIAEYNDANDRTRGQVLRLFRSAIALAKKASS